MKMNKRYFELDFLRGVAIILMIIFHFSYDLSYFGYADFQTTIDIQWRAFRSLILSLFLLLVGMGVYLNAINGIDWKKLAKRSSKLFVVSLLISLGSYFMFEHSWIYFGVIHFILVASIVALVFVKLPNVALFLGVAFLVSYILGYFHLDGLLEFFVMHFGFPLHTEDVVSFTPWFGMVLIGLFIMHHNLFSLKVKETKVSKKLAFLGQHSLLIYVVHQPILIGIFELIAWRNT